MKRGFICFLVLGLANISWAADDTVGSESQDVTSKVTGTTINFKYLDKNKRGAAKITNADNPAFNHLGSNTGVTSSVSTSNDFKPSAVNTNQAPFRYLYNNQYYQANPYLTYVQVPQAAQIAAQYSFQTNPVAHFLQTPTQIQYVAAPTVAQVPQIKYQTFGNDYSATNAAASQSASSSSSSSASTSSHYVAQPQQTSSAQYVSQGQQIYTPSSSSGQYVPQSQQVLSSASSAGHSSASTASQAKPVQVPFYSGFQTAQPLYYQQPYFIYPTANFIYQQPAANYLLKQQQQQQQQQIASLYGGHRFGLYNSGQSGQLTYLVPMAVSPSVQGSTSAATDLKSSGKATAQQSTPTNSFTYGTKA